MALSPRARVPESKARGGDRVRRRHLPRLLLRGVAAVAATTAVAADTVAGEHPTHSLVLVLVATVIAALQRHLAPRSAIALPAVSVAVAAQPALHLISKIGQPIPVAHDHGGLLHIVASEAPTASMQIVVPVLVLVAATIGRQLLYLLINALRRPLVSTPAPLAVRRPALPRPGPPASDRCCAGVGGRSAPRGADPRRRAWAPHSLIRSPPAD